MADLKDLTVEGFVQITSSDEPAPGGGSVSALAGALGAALAEMVARLTTGREKYADAEEAMQLVLKEAAQIKEELLLAIQKDSSSFEQYMTALSMPKSTEEEKAARRAAMQDGLKAAAQVPMSVARTAGRILPLARLAVTQGNSNAVTDGLVATMMARTAVLGALFNVRINLSSIRDEAFTSAMAEEADRLEAEALKGEQEILGEAAKLGLYRAALV
ncbi:cyclodeaminase/cyclohydrolase family protein [Cuneatibacter sp. NSJ-177]|uniref:cyclodeaminase/cyclohydrolase family protein n=1 Tax=Cuneatibacter sp. NSJ-177 TaxID=2931401 RepID=UPI001FD185F8|nr:cyclodeaminase/cyclohydrolase family protein [Cuneatibacter sp. NSJ-177]MCJ7837187.1 cyclodeaminase/cyclohydrolase family protein [Cuneatibacter sp. NSJ-177]